MAKLGKKREESQPDSESLVQAFAPCGNFPKDREGLLQLAQELKRASDDFQMPMESIIRECHEISQWCPTPHELRNVAKGMREELRPKAPLGCEICQGSGWRSYVHPVNGNDYADFCPCARGQWMRSMERQRKEEAKAKKASKNFTQAAS